MRNFLPAEFADAAKYAAYWCITLDAAMEAAGLDCPEGLAVCAHDQSWYIVDIDDDTLPVVASGYCDGGRLVAF